MVSRGPTATLAPEHHSGPTLPIDPAARSGKFRMRLRTSGAVPSLRSAGVRERRAARGDQGGQVSTVAPPGEAANLNPNARRLEVRMHKLKSLLLGSAAVAMAATGAKAADIAAMPAAPAPEPVEYVRVCKAFGEGFFVMPGTDTCLKIGGFVRFQIYAHDRNVGDSSTGSRWDGIPLFANRTQILGSGVTTATPFSTAAATLPTTGTGAGTQVSTSQGSTTATTTPVVTNAFGAAPGTFSTFANSPLFALNQGTGPNPWAAQNNSFAMQAHMVVNFDARTETPYGALRGFIQFRQSGTTTTDSYTVPPDMNAIFVQWGGWTFGVAPSPVDFDAVVTLGGEDIGNWNHGVLQASYTAQLGAGWSATLGIIDNQATNTQVLWNGFNANGSARNINTLRWGYFFHGVLVSPFGALQGSGASGTGGGWQAASLNTRTFAGVEDREELPALMGNIRVDQAWGSAMIGGGIREVHSRITDGAGAAYDEQTGQELGWTVDGGLSLKLPVVLPNFGFASGDKFVLRGAYGKGFSRFVVGAPDNDTAVPEAVWTGVCPVGSTNVQCFKLDLIGVWSVYAGITHYWTPELRSNLAGSWSSASTPLGPLSAYGGGGGWDEANVYLNLIWSPVKNPRVA